MVSKYTVSNLGRFWDTVYSVSQKNPPEVIWIFFIFSQTAKNF